MFTNVQFSTETKNQWARDDPAFLVIQLFFLVVSENLKNTTTLKHFCPIYVLQYLTVPLTYVSALSNHNPPFEVLFLCLCSSL